MEKIKIRLGSKDEMGFIEVPIVLSNNTEENLFQEDNICNLYERHVKSGIIPDFINLEKVAFCPVFFENGKSKEIDEIEFNFHFRERDLNTWTIKDGGGWNALPNDSQIDAVIARKSDLLGYLNFDIEDVRYQHTRLKKSFVRISYYDSPNPVEQQLLGYNTIFLDSNELCGKCIRNYTTLKSTMQEVDSFNGDNSKRLDSRITVGNKFSSEKSSEGFYLYLFNDELTNETPEKDIYLKIEFNHAGYGKTLLFQQPYKDSSVGVMNLGTEGKNIFNYIYIKVKIKYIDGRFVYYIEDDSLGVYTDEANKKIIFNMFEANIE